MRAHINKAAGTCLQNSCNNGCLVSDTQDKTSDLTWNQKKIAQFFRPITRQAENCELICVGGEAEKGSEGQVESLLCSGNCLLDIPRLTHFVVMCPVNFCHLCRINYSPRDDISLTGENRPAET